MLILTRKINESIIINDNIKIKLLACTGSQAKLGIEAEKNIPVDREEIYLSKKNKSGVSEN